LCFEFREMNLTANSDGNRLRIPVIVGPTASGKSSTSFLLSDRYNNIEIISADSRQIYKYLNIGTDKPTPAEIEKYHIHLVDFVEPGDRYTVFDFVEDASRIIRDCLSRDKIPLVCGGTGLYVKSLVEGIAEIPDNDLAIREHLEEEAVTKGPEYLFKRLEKIDPLEAAKTHPHNIKRIIRALEIFEITGKPKSELMASAEEAGGDFDFEVACLLPSREELYARINERVDLMIENGLLTEIEGIIEKGLKKAVAGVNVIGYNEFFRHFDCELGLPEAINLVKQNSRRFAKRQITWCRGMENIVFFKTPAELLRHFETERIGDSQ